ncbi:hypothetical protein T11_3753 [Trichinella zimbabwensis]|uniref:Uncharacterized protein n=1 Tax=Trichinella zimbabwensis TaxID=268475 RepID=A0A0V1HX31_9BILA|nr:hypothetical protein T11_3753 [Trichinella zimbabwensis]
MSDTQRRIIVLDNGVGWGIVLPKVVQYYQEQDLSVQWKIDFAFSHTQRTELHMRYNISSHFMLDSKINWSEKSNLKTEFISQLSIHRI